MRYDDTNYYSYNEIMQRKLARVSNELDKREGSVIYTAIAPDSAIDAEIYQELILRYNEGFADTCSREYLIRRCAEQGIEPYPATHAVITGTFVGANPLIGDRFSLVNNEVNFAVSSITDGTYYLTCETTGTIGNVSSGRLIPIVDIPGLTSATIASLYSLGDDEESTEALRNRYFDLFRFKRPFAGNISGFVELTNSIDGVGATKVVRAWNGGGTCKLIILDSNFDIPSPTLISNVQAIIDPTVSDSTDAGGLGLAPIFCKTTVVGGGSTAVNIVATITYKPGFNWTACKDAIFDAVDSYFDELIDVWQSTPSLEVKINRVLLSIISVTGVDDVSTITINGVSTNITLDNDKIPVMGTINGVNRS